MTSTATIRLLHQLARLYSLQTAYYDVYRRRQQASTESLVAMLRCLGAPITGLQDVAGAWRERRQALWQRVLEPVAVAWDGKPPLMPLRLPPVAGEATFSYHLRLENGEQRSWQCRAAGLPLIKTDEVEGEQYTVRQLTLPVELPRGYHRLTLELEGRLAECLIVSAPKRAHLAEGRSWGVFLPLYALYTDRSWGGGDYSDMEAMIPWVASLGGRVVATLPLLATFTSDLSPYRPVSRQLWNEFYVNIDSVPELSRCPAAQALVVSSRFQDEIGNLRNLPLVDYQRQMALKRKVLEELCQCLFSEPSHRLEALLGFAQSSPVVDDYARFRATCEEQDTPWPEWPHRLGEGNLKSGDYREDSRRFYLYAQWLAHQQIEGLSAKMRGEGLQLYLDLPLGVHPNGYDVWRERRAFTLGASTGAPPDVVFTRGQDWAFPPLHPEKIREQGYQYVIAYLRHHLRCASILRLDHVMGLHRLFCIPHGIEASRGVYLRYPAEELYAILSLESHRHQVAIAGEDLGTVPHYVRPAMKRHGLYRTYVLDYALASRESPPVPRRSVASLNTHDMPPFAAFWQDLDIQQRLGLGILDREGAERERESRQYIKKNLVAFLQDKGWIKETGVADAGAALRGCLSLLAASQAYAVLVNLEDLWLETMPQNVPSTSNEYPNWQRKARYSFNQFCQMPQILDTLGIINHLRKQVR